jgi:hypothetical protein
METGVALGGDGRWTRGRGGAASGPARGAPRLQLCRGRAPPQGRRDPQPVRHGADRGTEGGHRLTPLSRFGHRRARAAAPALGHAAQQTRPAAAPRPAPPSAPVIHARLPFDPPSRPLRAPPRPPQEPAAKPAHPYPSPVDPSESLWLSPPLPAGRVRPCTGWARDPGSGASPSPPRCRRPWPCACSVTVPNTRRNLSRPDRAPPRGWHCLRLTRPARRIPAARASVSPSRVLHHWQVPCPCQPECCSNVTG